MGNCKSRHNETRSRDAQKISAASVHNNSGGSSAALVDDAVEQVQPGGIAKKEQGPSGGRSLGSRKRTNDSLIVLIDTSPVNEQRETENSQPSNHRSAVEREGPSNEPECSGSPTLLSTSLTTPMPAGDSKTTFQYPDSPQMEGCRNTSFLARPPPSGTLSCLAMSPATPFSSTLWSGPTFCHLTEEQLRAWNERLEERAALDSATPRSPPLFAADASPPRRRCQRKRETSNEGSDGTASVSDVATNEWDGGSTPPEDESRDARKERPLIRNHSVRNVLTWMELGGGICVGGEDAVVDGGLGI